MSGTGAEGTTAGAATAAAPADRWPRAKELFLAASELPPAEREPFLVESCGDDPTLRDEVLSLLSHHVPAPLFEEPTAPALPSRPLVRGRPDEPTTDGFAAPLLRALGKRRPRLAAFGVVALLLLSLGAAGFLAIRRSVKETAERELVTLRNSQVHALRLWVEDWRRQASAFAADPRVSAAAARLADVARAGEDAPLRERLLAAPERSDLDRLAAPFIGPELNDVLAILDPRGRPLFAASTTGTPGRVGGVVVPKAMPWVAEAFSGKTLFVPPVFAAGGTRRGDGRSVDDAVAGPPIAWVVAPVRDPAGRTVAVLAFGRRSDGGFSSIFAVGRMGETGETYAFDREARLLVESRFADALRKAGIVPGGSGTALVLLVTDPGGEVLRGYRPLLEPEERPRTRLAAAAIASRVKEGDAAHLGSLMEPYRDYRGVPSVGAWAWLPEYGLGVATEVDVREAFAPLRLLGLTYAALFLVLVGAAGAALGSAASLARSRAAARSTKRIGPYEVVRKLGEGGMGTVWLAHHALLRRPTAVKVIREDVASEEARFRFEREVRLAARLRHPNTIEVYDFGLDEAGSFFCAMEYVEGLTLAELVRQGGPLATGRALHLLAQLCASLREAHGLGLVHRDVKPQNVMLCRQGGELDFVKVLDFGLVKEVDNPHTRVLTVAEKVAGTLLYMAPERLSDPANADARVDVYAVGAVAYFLLSGRPVFEARSDLDLLRQVLEEEPAPLSRLVPSVPPGLERLVASCLSKDPAGRPRGIEEVLASIDLLRARFPWDRAEARSWWAARDA